MAAAVASPPIKKSRRVRRRSSSFTSLSGSTISGCRSLMLIHHFVADHHTSKVVPTSKRHLHNVHQEEDTIADRQHEMNTPRACISAEYCGQPAQLNGFVNRESR